MNRMPLLLSATLLLALPLTAHAGDREMAENIADSFRTSGKLQRYDIRIKYEDGTVWLRGRVASQEQLDVALQIAAQTEGVKHVSNGLSVRIESEATQPAPPRPGTTGESGGSTDPQPKTVVENDHAKEPVHRQPQPPAIPAEAVPTRPQFGAEPLRTPKPRSIAEHLPATSRSTTFWSRTHDIRSTSTQMASSLASAAATSFLIEDADETAGETFLCDYEDVSAGEVIATDCSDATPVLLHTLDVATSPASPDLGPDPASSSNAPRQLHQATRIRSEPEPTRRTRSGFPGSNLLPAMHAKTIDQ